MQNLYKKLIVEQFYTVYKNKQIEVEKSEESLLLNINKLAEPSTYLDNKGNPKRYIPLPIKELAWKLLYPEGCIKTTTKLVRIGLERNDKEEEVCCHAECYLFRTLEEMERGLYVQMLEKDFFCSLRYLNEFKSEKERFEALRPYAQAIVTSHCLTKFGLGLGIDSVEEDMELLPNASDTASNASEEFSPVDEIVNTKEENSLKEDFTEAFENKQEDVATAEQGKKHNKGGRKKKEEVTVKDAVTEVVADETIAEEVTVKDAVTEVVADETVAEEVTVEDAVTEVVANKTVTEEVAVEDAVTEVVADEIVTKQTPTEEAVAVTPSSIDFNDGVQTTLFDAEANKPAPVRQLTYEEALNYVCEHGKLAGDTFGEIIVKLPNNFKFLYTKGRHKFDEQALLAMQVIVDNNEEIRNLVENA